MQKNVIVNGKLNLVKTLNNVFPGSKVDVTALSGRLHVKDINLDQFKYLHQVLEFDSNANIFMKRSGTGITIFLESDLFKKI